MTLIVLPTPESQSDTVGSSNAVQRIATVEVELSLFETGILRNGVAKVCAELDIPVIAYSPLGRGTLTGKITNAADVPAGLRRLDRYQGGNLEHNIRLINELQKLSEEHTDQPMSVFALSWVRQLSRRDGLGDFIPICGSTRPENVRTNSLSVALSEQEFERIADVLREYKTMGARSYPGQQKYLEG